MADGLPSGMAARLLGNRKAHPSVPARRDLRQADAMDRAGPAGAWGGGPSDVAGRPTGINIGYPILTLVLAQPASSYPL